ncbi:MAG: hypothetical protein WBC20_11035 [Candidatus Aminicenantaceae bacterium]
MKKPFEGELRSAGSKTRNFCPSESKAARFQASLSQNGSCTHFVNHARFAFKRFFYLLAFAKLKYLYRWGKSCVFSESTGPSLYILAARLCRISSKSNSGRLNLQRSLQPSPNTFLFI